LINGLEVECAVVPRKSSRAEPAKMLARPIGWELVVREDHKNELIEVITVLPQKVSFAGKPDGPDGWFELVGDRHWTDARGADYDTLRTGARGVVLKPRGDPAAEFTLPIEYMEAFNVGVTLRAGAPQKSTETGGGVTTTKAPG
jgi:hypothetical protein